MSYEDYCARQWDEMSHSDDCPSCEERDEKLYQVEISAKRLAAILYGAKEFSAADIEKYMDEIFEYLDIPLYQGTIQVEKKRPSKAAFLQNWLNYNKEFLEQA